MLYKLYIIASKLKSRIIFHYFFHFLRKYDALHVSPIQLQNQQQFLITNVLIPFDFMVFLPAGHSLEVETTSTAMAISGCTKQIATIDGVLTQPS